MAKPREAAPPQELIDLVKQIVEESGRPDGFNAQAWLQLEDPVTWLWSFVGGAPKINHFSDRSQMLAVTPEAEAMSKALKKAGFTFVGPTICYAFMQATGMVNDHITSCHCHDKVKALSAG